MPLCATNDIRQQAPIIRTFFDISFIAEIRQGLVNIATAKTRISASRIQSRKSSRHSARLLHCLGVCNIQQPRCNHPGKSPPSEYG